VPVLPSDPFALVGFAMIAATIGGLVFSDWPKAYLLAVSTIALFALQFVEQSFASARLGLYSLSLVPANLAEGAWWSPVTYAFLHGGFLHIVGNLFILVTAGPGLEDSVGPGWFLAIYAAGALGAGLAGVGLAYVPAELSSITLPSTLTPMVGSSGAIFAVLTAFAVRHPREKLPLPFYIILWLPSMVVLAVFLAMNVGYIFLDNSVAWYGHFAGFLAGLAIASLPIDFAGTSTTTRLNVERLEPLADNEDARKALNHLQDIEENEADVAEVWLDEFAQATTCPVCEHPLERDGMSVACPNGHDATDEA
jgi:membrane associated rhomboid family serine protease